MTDIQERITRFQEFFDLHYKSKIHEVAGLGQKSLVVDFRDLVKFDHELAEYLVAQPEDTLKELAMAVEQFDLQQTTAMRIRLSNLPLSQKVKIRDIRSEHLGRLIAMEGIVRQASDVRPQVISAKFECPSCGNLITIPQVEQRFREPFRCSCGKRGRFKVVGRELVDTQRLVVEESPEALEGGEQPKRLSVFLREDLVEPRMEKKTTPGAKILIFAVIKEVAIQFKSGAQSTRYDLIAEANNIEPIEETYEDIDISKEDEIKIKQLAKDPRVYEKFVSSMGISIFGHEGIKGALVLQLMGGVKKERSDGTATKGDIHILLVGDPGSAKTSLLLFMSKAAPKARYVAGKGASAAGLCVAPDSLIATNPGGIHRIQDMVDQKLCGNIEEYREGIWRAKDANDLKKVFTLDDSLKMRTSDIGQFWKIQPPEYMVRLITRSGKEVVVTPNTKLFSIEDCNLVWKEADVLKEGDHLAAPTHFSFQNKNKQLTLTLITSNPIVYGVKNELKKMFKGLCEKSNITLRELAKKLGLNENKLYHHWVNSSARGNIHLKDLLRLADITGYNLEDIAHHVTGFASRRGCRIKLPVYLNEDFMYLCGLIASDGDIDNHHGKGAIRFSNNSPALQKMFNNIVAHSFSIRCNLSSKQSDKRAEAWRFSAKIITEIMENLGIPSSPKSHRIDLTNALLTLPDKMVRSFLQGYFDGDGSVTHRTEGSSVVEVTSASPTFIKKLQLVLLRFGIQSKRRIKPKKASIYASKKIIPRYDKHVLEIRSRKNLRAFQEYVGFTLAYKRETLRKAIGSISHEHTNVDVVPGANKALCALFRKYHLRHHEIFGGASTRGGYVGISELSRRALKKIIPRLQNHVDTNDALYEKLSLLADAEVTWEKIVHAEKVYDHGYPFVYDLTVENSHNFVVNGIVVHNTASVVKDEFLRGWALEAGAIVLANGGILLLDEMDKMSVEDTSGLHEALAQQRVSISKANIQATLKAQTTVLAAANPKYGRFDPYQPIAAQIDLPPALINRFDLIFPVRDLPSKEKDTKIATHILELQRQTEEMVPEVSIEMIKKYVAYARKTIFPRLTEEAVEEIKEFYVGLRNMPTVGDEGGVKPIPISARQLEALVRLSEASARVRLSEKVTRNDARTAINILKHCLMQVGFDYETGQIDIDRISTGIPASTRSKIIIIRDIINGLDAKGKKSIPIEDILAGASEKNLKEDQVEEVLEKLKREGEIFEPRRGFISKV